MEYDFRNRLNPPYNSQSTTYNPTPPSTHPIYGSPSLYPKIGHSVASPAGRNNNSSSHQTSPSSGMGVRVTIKPEYRMTPPPQMTRIREIPRSTFQFDFELEMKILAEAEKENPNWSKLGLENLPQKTSEPVSHVNSTVDPVASKYVASGLNREAVPIAIAKFGDNPTKVHEFANGYTLLREMGFTSSSISKALIAYDNDTEAAAHFLSASS